MVLPSNNGNIVLMQQCVCVVYGQWANISPFSTSIALGYDSIVSKLPAKLVHV